MKGINYTETHGQMAAWIMDQLDLPNADKLSWLTTEELFYVKKLMERKATKSQFILSMRYKLKTWLNSPSTKRPLPFEALARYWKREWEELCIEEEFA